MTTNPADPGTSRLAELGHVPAYICGKCGQAVLANETHNCPAMVPVKPLAVAGPPEQAEGSIRQVLVLVDSLENDIAALAGRVAVLEAQMAAILAGTLEQPPERGTQSVEELMEPKGRRKR